MHNRYVIWSTVLLVVLLIVVYLYKTDWFLVYHLQSYRPVLKKRLGKILIAVPTIDRDIDKAPEMHSRLVRAIDVLRPFVDIIDLIVVTRESDKQSQAFWKDRAQNIITVSSYSILGRHNLEQMAKTYNRIIDYTQKGDFDAVVIIESDVFINKKTLSQLIKSLVKYHIAFAYGDIPWCSYPYVVVPGIVNFRTINAREHSDFQPAVGGWLGAVAIRQEVFDDCNFSVGKFKNVIGQDVGFYRQAFYKRYSVAYTSEVFHNYK